MFVDFDYGLSIIELLYGWQRSSMNIYSDQTIYFRPRDTI